MCNCTDEVWIEQPDVYEQLISREAHASITLWIVQWYWACDTQRGRRTSVRHTTWSANKRATHNAVGERACDTQRGRRISVRQTTGSANERATQRSRRRETSRREQRACVAIQWRNVARENYVNGMCVSGDLYALRSVYLWNWLRRWFHETDEAINLLIVRTLFIGLCHLFICTSLNVLYWLHLISIHTEYMFSILY